MVLVRNIRLNQYLEEGHIYPFLIRKQIELPNGGFAWILEDEQGVKHTLSADYYHDYSFKPGDKIRCKVDKINCTGKIYLEPEHPYYRQGRTYEFDVVSGLVMPDIFGAVSG